MHPRLSKATKQMAAAKAAVIERTKHAPTAAKDGLARLRTNGVHVSLNRYEEAIHAVRPHVAAKILWVFIIGFSIDDLLVMRIPSAWLALAMALYLGVFGGLQQGRILARRRAYIKDDADFKNKMRSIRRAGQLTLIFTVIAFLGWLMLFASGVPPWAV